MKGRGILACSSPTSASDIPTSLSRHARSAARKDTTTPRSTTASLDDDPAARVISGVGGGSRGENGRHSGKSEAVAHGRCHRRVFQLKA